MSEADRYWTWSRGVGKPMRQLLWRATLVVERTPRRRIEYAFLQVRIPFTALVLELNKTTFRELGSTWSLLWWSSPEGAGRVITRWRGWS